MTEVRRIAAQGHDVHVVDSDVHEGTRGPDHRTVEAAGHFLQEDAGAELGRVVADFMLH